MDKKLVIVAALTGGMQQSREGAFVPTQPAEIAEEAYRCYQAGASVIHIHARDRSTQVTADLQVFDDIIQRIRAKCDVLVQTTNGMGIINDPITGKQTWPADEDRLGMLRLKNRQDLLSIAAGSWDFFHPDGGYPDTFTFVNSANLLRENIKAVLATNLALEFEITEASFLHKLARLADEGVFDREEPRFWLNYGFGFGAQPSTLEAFAYAVGEGRRLFPRTKWQVVATGRDAFRMTTFGILAGSDIARVGFEDSLFLPNGTIASNNHVLVEKIAEIGRTFGREPASVDEARQIFGLR